MQGWAQLFKHFFDACTVNILWKRCIEPNNEPKRQQCSQMLTFGEPLFQSMDP